SLNLAALWRLPVLFLCENNLYAMGTRLDRAQSQIDLTAKARSYLMPADPVDGMDVSAVETATRRAAEAVRRGEGPAFLELNTYRFRAHSMFDAELYREKSEVERWKLRDPITTFTASLRQAGAATDALIAGIETSVSNEIERAVQFAEDGTWEPVADLLKDVYTPVEARRSAIDGVA
ncbi:MAG: pyruvate dehydrogenase (acetyl-transferring) E1 component subunit alpha, partial [Acidobacteria bacterium]|nr:pyruvate dehydrogenase (acetyl-transferring) E1 component subunit alpha [Acidobacteriota bacterium]